MGRSLPFLTQPRTVWGLTQKAFASAASVKSWGTHSDNIHLARFLRNQTSCGGNTPLLPLSRFPRLGRTRNALRHDSLYLSLWNQATTADGYRVHDARCREATRRVNGNTPGIRGLLNALECH